LRTETRNQYGSKPEVPPFVVWALPRADILRKLAEVGLLPVTAIVRRAEHERQMPDPAWNPQQYSPAIASGSPTRRRCKEQMPVTPKRRIRAANASGDVPEVLTVGDIAALTGYSRQTVTKMFENETGVIVVRRPEKLHKRSYRSIRIPHPVFERVIRRMSN
jgi:hypothetical protein